MPDPRPTASAITDPQLEALYARLDAHANLLADWAHLATVTHAHRGQGGHDQLGAGLTCAGCHPLTLTLAPTPPASPLRDRIVEALANWSMRDGAGRGLTRLNATVRTNAESRADAVMAVVGPELERLRGQVTELEAQAEMDRCEAVNLRRERDSMKHVARRNRRHAQSLARLTCRAYDELDRLEAAAVNADGVPLTPRSEGIVRAVRRVRGVLDGGEQP